MANEHLITWQNGAAFMSDADRIIRAAAPVPVFVTATLAYHRLLQNRQTTTAEIAAVGSASLYRASCGMPEACETQLLRLSAVCCIRLESFEVFSGLNSHQQAVFFEALIDLGNGGVAVRFVPLLVELLTSSQVDAAWLALFCTMVRSLADPTPLRAVLPQLMAAAAREEFLPHAAKFFGGIFEAELGSANETQLEFLLVLAVLCLQVVRGALAQPALANFLWSTIFGLGAELLAAAPRLAEAALAGFLEAMPALAREPGEFVQALEAAALVAADARFDLVAPPMLQFVSSAVPHDSLVSWGEAVRPVLRRPNTLALGFLRMLTPSFQLAFLVAFSGDVVRAEFTQAVSPLIFSTQIPAVLSIVFAGRCARFAPPLCAVWTAACAGVAESGSLVAEATKAVFRMSRNSPEVGFIVQWFARLARVVERGESPEVARLALRIAAGRPVARPHLAELGIVVGSLPDAVQLIRGVRPQANREFFRTLGTVMLSRASDPDSYVEIARELASFRWVAVPPFAELLRIATPAALRVVFEFAGEAPARALEVAAGIFVAIATRAGDELGALVTKCAARLDKPLAQLEVAAREVLSVADDERRDEIAESFVSARWLEA
jgi:hypothetical protein